MDRLFLAATLVLAVSCGPGQPTYLDRVKALPREQANPLVQQTFPLLLHPTDRSPDDLMRVWKEFLGDNPRPIHQDSVYTFVYYDFSHTLEHVSLQASFSPTHPQALVRLGTTGLFYRVFDIPKPDRLKYRYSDGTNVLLDPFHPEVGPGDELWHLGTETPDGEITIQKVVGASETLLAGQDLSVVLPPMYRRNLASTYPLVVVVDVEGDEWVRPLSHLMEQISVRPFLAVSLGNKNGGPWSFSDLKGELEEHVMPWLKSRYRVSSQPADVVLVGWGPDGKAVQAVVSTRPDLWPKSWIPPSDRGPEDWNEQAQAWLKQQFPTVAP